MLLAKEMGAKSLLAKSDSLLVTGQVTGEYQVKDPQMAAYLEYVQILKESVSMFELVHVSREQNARADLLAKLASSGKGGKQRTVIQETLRTPRTTTGSDGRGPNTNPLKGHQNVKLRQPLELWSKRGQEDAFYIS